MSFFSWFAAKPSPALGPNPDAGTGGASKQGVAVEANDRRIKRQARREQLYLVMRETMTDLGVLSASYKFKVLALDSQGDKFLVMVDLSQSLAATGAQAHDAEKQIIEAALHRFEIVVTAVYWRANVAMTQPLAAGTASSASSNTPLSTLPSAQVSRAEGGALHAHEDKLPVHASVRAPRYEPIEADEVAAFRQALQAAAPKRAEKSKEASKARIGRSSYALLTGFEETELPHFSPVLGSTQYGDLI